MIAIEKQNRIALVSSAKRLEYFTIIWNLLEGLVSLAAGLFSGSISLVGFGVDSFIEVASGSIVLWRMSVDHNIARREHNEHGAQAGGFLIYWVIVLFDIPGNHEVP